MQVDKISMYNISCYGLRDGSFKKVQKLKTIFTKHEGGDKSNIEIKKYIQEQAKKLSDLFIKILDTF